MKSKFAGICSRSGERYAAGTEITKTSKGWEIAAGQRIGTASNPVVFKMARLPNGKVKSIPINKPSTAISSATTGCTASWAINSAPSGSRTKAARRGSNRARNWRNGCQA